nr:hypothetical protein [Paenibacillus lemnae]
MSTITHPPALPRLDRIQPQRVYERHRIAVHIREAVHAEPLAQISTQHIAVHKPLDVRVIVAGAHVVQAVYVGLYTVAAVVGERLAGAALMLQYFSFIIAAASGKKSL